MSYIVINEDLRTMTIPEDIVLLGVESDDDVNKILFQMPSEYSGFDLSAFSARINYMNANGEGDVYLVDDLTVSENEPSTMTFTWLVGRNACKYKGDTKFIVCLKLFDENANVIKEFNTTVYSLPVLEGLETTEAVQQENPDIIEYILNLIEESGIVDPEHYYTKTEIDAMLPTELPNPEPITINGTTYDGSEAVDMTIVAESDVLSTASGKIIHLVDAVANDPVQSLTLYDGSDGVVASASLAVANKNLFRLDLIASHVVSKGITFNKNPDGSITASGTSTGQNATTSCNLSKNMFVVGKTYTLSTGKTLGFVCVVLQINYTDSTTDLIIARNSAKTFSISKAVASAVASVQIADYGVTIDGETVYPMLELSGYASAFVDNVYDTMTYDGSVMPVLPDTICNVWSNDDTVANMQMQYTADTVYTKINDYAEENLRPGGVNGVLVSTYDGLGTVSVGVG